MRAPAGGPDDWRHACWKRLDAGQMPGVLRDAAWHWCWAPVEPLHAEGAEALVRERVDAVLSAFQLGGYDAVLVLTYPHEKDAAARVRPKP